MPHMGRLLEKEKGKPPIRFRESGVVRAAALCLGCNLPGPRAIRAKEPIIIQIEAEGGHHVTLCGMVTPWIHDVKILSRFASQASCTAL
jgi:hypothetical protein